MNHCALEILDGLGDRVPRSPPPRQLRRIGLVGELEGLPNFFGPSKPPLGPWQMEPMAGPRNSKLPSPWWLGPPAIGALLVTPFFGWEGSPTEIDYRQKWVPTCSNLSNLLDLVGNFGHLPGCSRREPSGWPLRRRGVRPGAAEVCASSGCRMLRPLARQTKRRRFPQIFGCGYPVPLVNITIGGCGSKNRYQNGTLVSGVMEQNLRNPPWLILSHAQVANGCSSTPKMGSP